MKDPQDRVPPVRVTDEPQRAIVRVGGEIDIDRAPLLQEALHTVITRPECPDEIVVDLTGLTFCDSSGLNALLHARLTAAEYARYITLHAPNPQVLRLLEITGVDSIFHVTGT